MHKRLLAAMLPLFVGAAVLCAPAAPQNEAQELAANPGRPTVSMSPDVLPPGVIQVEYGWQRFWPGAGANASRLGGQFRFAPLADLELRVYADNYSSLRSQAGGHRGVGDGWLSAQYQLAHQGESKPSLALGYAVKFPGASSVDRLGSGQVDHAVSFMAGKNARGFGITFTAIYLFAGRAGARGFDRNVEFALSSSHAIRGKLGMVGEVYAANRLNAATPGFGSTLCALTYAPGPRLVIDAGVDIALTSGAPRKRVFAGVTYAMGNLYAGLKHRHSRAEDNVPRTSLKSSVILPKK